VWLPPPLNFWLSAAVSDPNLPALTVAFCAPHSVPPLVGLKPFPTDLDRVRKGGGPYLSLSPPPSPPQAWDDTALIDRVEERVDMLAPGAPARRRELASVARGPRETLSIAP